MLLTRVNEAKGKILELKRLKEMARRAKEYDSRARQVEQPILGLAVLDPALAEFHRRSIEINLSASSREAIFLQTISQGVLNRFNEDPVTVLDGDPQIVRTFWDPLGELPGKVRTTVREAWQAYVDTLLPSPQVDLLQILEQVPGFGDQVKRIRELARQAGIARQKLPQSSADFDSIIEIAASLKDAWRRLTGTGLPEEVLTFLRDAVDSRGADLTSLTPTTRAWLEEHELIPAIRVILRSIAAPGQ